MVREVRMITELVLVLILAAGLLCAQSPTPALRNIEINGHALTAYQLAQLEAVERRYNVHIRDAQYWYDQRSGATGLWNGPALAAMPPGLDFGPMPADCSGRGTGVFVNGRELHPLEVQTLSSLGPVNPGRYWLDANGFFGLQLRSGDSPALGNLIVLSRQAQSRGQQHRVYAPGELSGIIVNSAGACTDQGNCAYPGH
jgi:hypothetical protein